MLPKKILSIQKRHDKSSIYTIYWLVKVFWNVAVVQTAHHHQNLPLSLSTASCSKLQPFTQTYTNTLEPGIEPQTVWSVNDLFCRQTTINKNGLVLQTNLHWLFFHNLLWFAKIKSAVHCEDILPTDLLLSPSTVSCHSESHSTNDRCSAMPLLSSDRPRCDNC